MTVVRGCHVLPGSAVLNLTATFSCLQTSSLYGRRIRMLGRFDYSDTVGGDCYIVVISDANKKPEKL